MSKSATPDVKFKEHAMRYKVGDWVRVVPKFRRQFGEDYGCGAHQISEIMRQDADPRWVKYLVRGSGLYLNGHELEPDPFMMAAQEACDEA